MKRALWVSVCALVLVSVVNAQDMRSWFVGMWRMDSQYVFQPLEIDGIPAFEATVYLSIDRLAIHEFRSDGTMISGFENSALWEVKKSGDNWAIISETTSENAFLSTWIRKEYDTALVIRKLPYGTAVLRTWVRVD